jgi:predicted MFS family arabinose efflux permease
MHWATRGDNRKAVEDGTETRKFKWSTVRDVVTDPHLYLQALVQASNTVPNNGFKFTMPQIIRNMGFTSTKAQLLSAPPYFSGAIAAVVSSLWADKHSRRMPPILFFQGLVLVSMSVLFRYAPQIATQTALCYSMVVLACIGAYPIVPGCNAWTVNNLAGPEKRSMGVAFTITMTNIGGFIGSWIFLGYEAPEYPTGFGTCIAFAALGMCAATLVQFLYRRHNKKWEGVSREEIEARFTPAELEKLGDRSPLFKYGL